MMRNTGAEATLEIRKCVASDYIVEFKMSGLSFKDAVSIGVVLDDLREKYGKSFMEDD